MKTDSGKIKRRTCRLAFLNDSLDAIAKSILEETNTEEIENRLTRKTLLATSGVERQHKLETYLQLQLAGVLEVDPLLIDLQQPLLQLGLDSLSTVTLRNRLEVDLEVSIPDTIFLENINGNSLVAKIITQLITGKDTPRVPLLTTTVNQDWEEDVI